MVDFVQMDPAKTIEICNTWFDSDYMRIADALKDHKDLAFNFLNTVLEQNEAVIIEEHNTSMLAASTIIAVAHPQKWVPLLLRLVELLTEKKFKSRITEYVSRDYFPIDETLEICKRK